MAAPTFVAEYESLWSGSNPATQTASVTVNAGDVLVVVALTQDDAITVDTPTGGTGISWTLEESVVVTNHCSAYIWTSVMSTGQTFTLSVSKIGSIGGNDWGFNCLKFSASDGIGASAKANAASGAPSLALTTTQDNSAIVVVNGDWNALSSSRTWRTGAGALTEKTYVYAGSNIYTAYAGYHADAGTAGSKTVGLTAPTGQTYSIIAVEVLGTVAGPPLPPGTLRNNFNGGPDGATLTTGNSGQRGDVAFDVAFPGSGTLQFADAGVTALDRPTAEFVLSSATPGGSGTSSYVAWSTSMGSQAEVWVRFYVRFSGIATTASSRTMFSLFSSGGLATCLLLLLRTDTTPYCLQLKDKVGAVVTMSSTPVVPDVWGRVELHANITAGTSELYYYAGDDVDTETYTDTISQSGDYGGGTCNLAALGVAIGYGENTPPVYYSNLELNTTGFPGPEPFRAGKGVPGILTNPIAVHVNAAW